MSRQMHLGVFIYPGGHHIAAWRHPDMQAHRVTELDYYRETAALPSAANSTCISSATR